MPLLDMIIPQIAKRVAEIQQQTRPQGTAPAAGYLGAGNVDAKAEPPTASDKALEALRSAPAQSPMEVMKNSALRQLGEDRMRSKHQALIPNAQVPDPLAPAPAEGKVTKRNGKSYLALKPGETVMVDELGRPLDAKGKPGYLKQPMLVTPGGDAGMRTGVQRPSDVFLNPGGAYKFQQPNDQMTAQALEQLYGGDLQAMELNRDANGNPTDQFPAGHFRGMTEGEIANVKQGVEALRQIRRANEGRGPLM